MDVFETLDHLEERLKLLLNERKNMREENADLRKQLDQMKVEIHRQSSAINNLEEQNKSAKLAGGHASDQPSLALKEELDALIKEIDQCIKLVKR